jgi:protein-disulfide isomerase
MEPQEQTSGSSSSTTTTESTISTLSTPIAIVIAGALVAAALFFGGTGTAVRPAGQDQKNAGPEKLVPVSASDHVFGDPKAPITIIEYSDLECPFCKQFHGTMKAVVAAYPGKVKWVYRNFPLEQLHPNAPKLAEAAECVAALGGNDTYWAFLDELFRRAPINTQFDLSQLNAAVTAVGVNANAFTTCYQAGTYRAKIAQETEDAVASGGNGTPHNILIDKKGKSSLIPGAQPLDVVKAAIEAAL